MSDTARLAEVSENDALVAGHALCMTREVGKSPSRAFLSAGCISRLGYLL